MDLEQQPQPLSFGILQCLLGCVTYKKGFNFSLFQDETMSRTVLYVRATVPNAYDLTKNTELFIRAIIPTWVIRTPEDFFLWIQQRLIEMEIHECLEFFRIDGKPLYNPHDPVEPTKGVSRSGTPATPGNSSGRGSKKTS